MARSKKTRSPDAPGRGDTGVTLSELGLRGTTISRRGALKAGLGVAAGAGLAAVAGTAAAPPAQAGLNRLTTSNARRVGPVVDANNRKIPNTGQFTGPTLTDRWQAHYTDLCIPVRCPDGTLLLVGGDTYPASGPPDNPPPNPLSEWRCPIGLRTTSNPLDPNVPIKITDAVQDRAGHAKALTNPPEPHGGTPPTTALPSDVFACNGKLYMHLMRGPIYDTHHTDFWVSGDNGQNWAYLRQWDRSLYNFQFQQKTYAAETSNLDGTYHPYVYVMSTIYNRGLDSDLYLFRVFKSDLDADDIRCRDSGFGPYFAYEPWGFKNGAWNWGNPPTTITNRRLWGEICFRAMPQNKAYALSWLQPNNNVDLIDIRAQAFATPTSDLVATVEQTMVYNSANNPASRNPAGAPSSVQDTPYGGFIFPGSTFANFHFAVSNWNKPLGYAPNNVRNYCVSQWRTSLKY